MALTGSRAISVIGQAPKKRKFVKTTVAKVDKDIIKDAIQFELDRGGQVYYVCKEIEDVYMKSSLLNELFPDSEICIAHGQLDQEALNQSVQMFIDNKSKIMVCTTIIENGIDIANANTIIIENAQYYGLSQIHQLRGRVGRSSTQSYAYILYPADKPINDLAKKRLQAIKEYVSIGSGYHLAMKDLEIRGAGSLLGHKQHGHITNIGFDLYCKLLQNTMSINQESSNKLASIQMGKDSYIPSEYIDNSRQRLAIYERLLNANSIKQLNELKYELNDRYGEVPLTILNIINSIKKAAKKIIISFFTFSSVVFSYF